MRTAVRACNVRVNSTRWQLPVDDCWREVYGTRLPLRFDTPHRPPLHHHVGLYTLSPSLPRSLRTEVPLQPFIKPVTPVPDKPQRPVTLSPLCTRISSHRKLDRSRLNARRIKKKKSIKIKRERNREKCAPVYIYIVLDILYV